MFQPKKSRLFFASNLWTSVLMNLREVRRCLEGRASFKIDFTEDGWRPSRPHRKSSNSFMI